jgi:hypothetical protein
MLVHTVFFWLKPDLDKEAIDRFRQGLETLKRIKHVEKVFVGTPADTNRPVIDRSYSFGLTVLFKDQAGHDAYQVDPLHLAFVKDYCDPLRAKVLIYDFVE